MLAEEDDWLKKEAGRLCNNGQTVLAYGGGGRQSDEAWGPKCDDKAVKNFC